MSSAKTSQGMEIRSSNAHTLFLPAFIDDFGSTAEEFRVFGRIMRRSLGGGDCYESIPSLAKSLMISERLIRRALNVLEACNAITRTMRPGKSDIYDFNPANKWKPSSELVNIRRRIDAEIKLKDRERKRSRSNLVVAETTGVSGCGNATTPLAETTPPVVAETQDEGTPIEGKRMKEAVAGKVSNPLQAASANPRTGSVNQKPVFRSARKSAESQTAYFARKQTEFPLIDIPALFKKYCAYCKERSRPPTRPNFDSWCAAEEPPMEMPLDTGNAYVNPMTGRGLR